MTLCPHHWKIGGVSLNSKLWTAKILAEQPELIKQVHKNYFKAGADCGITCSYQASIPGLMENGYTLEEAENLIRSAVKIFCEVAKPIPYIYVKPISTLFSLGRSIPDILAIKIYTS